MNEENLFINLMTSRRYRVLRHLLLNLVFAVVAINAFGNIYGDFVFDKGKLFLWVIFYLVLIAENYLNIYCLTPQLLQKGKYKQYFAALIFATIAFILIMFVSRRNNNYDATQIHTPTIIVLNTLSSFIAIMMLIASMTTFVLFRRWIDEQRNVGELRVSTAQSELKFLKRQINPHFLFNMLNNANVLIRRDADEASRVLFKLEDMIRYNIDGGAQEKVLLDSDISFLNDFLNLEKLRRDKFEYSITTAGNTAEIRLPPLLFVPFVENAVKHNNDSEYGSYVHIKFSVNDNILSFRCENSKPHINAIKSTAGGLGLQNISRRLELLYPSRHKLLIDDNPDKYTVNLIITL